MLNEKNYIAAFSAIVSLKGSISDLMTVTFQRILFSDLALLLFLYLLVLSLILAD